MHLPAKKVKWENILWIHDILILILVLDYTIYLLESLEYFGKIVYSLVTVRHP